ncbi:DUF6087 family protein [Streptomyces sp. NPDC053427]|uniref:DUF6087 family protein n=1 Tax=Streptomyces sp. NPDC053427 TaxID=3365701 RepID=UPI0037D16B11
MDDEPLDRWAARRAKRLRTPGTRKAVQLGPGPQQAAHVAPDAPRLIVEWDGYQWIPVVTVDNYAAACRFLNPVPEPAEEDEAPPARSPMAPGTGRHRKP